MQSLTVEKGPGTSNQGVGPVTLTSCFCLCHCTERTSTLAWLLFWLCIPGRAQEQSDAIYPEPLFDAFFKRVISSKLQKYSSFPPICVVYSNVDSFHFMCRGLQIYTLKEEGGCGWCLWCSKNQQWHLKSSTVTFLCRNKVLVALDNPQTLL